MFVRRSVFVVSAGGRACVALATAQSIALPAAQAPPSPRPSATGAPRPASPVPATPLPASPVPEPSGSAPSSPAPAASIAPATPVFPFPFPSPGVVQAQAYATFVRGATTLPGVIKLFRKDDDLYFDLAPENFGKTYIISPSLASGVGAGAVYGTCVGNAVKWFGDRRGLAAGLTAAGYGAGAAATVVPIVSVIRNYGYDKAFLWFGLGQGLVILVMSQFLKAPKPGEAPRMAKRVSQSPREFRPTEMLRTPLFWILYVMFVTVAASGLVVTAQVASIAADYKIAKLPISFLFISSTVLVMAGIVDNILNGLARPTFGWVSDHIGRENTMAIAFGAGGIAYWLLGSIGTSPWAFVVFAALIFLTWGEISACSRRPAPTRSGRNSPPPI